MHRPLRIAFLATTVLAAAASAAACSSQAPRSSSSAASATPGAGSGGGAKTGPFAGDAGTPSASADAGTTSPTGPTGPKGPTGPELIAQRPYTLNVPSGYDPKTPTPVVLLFHGYTASGAIQEGYFQLGPVAEAKTFLYAYADGTIDAKGNRFWNATDACCNFDGKAVDDVAYATAILDDISARYNVDAKRVFVVGHSNGGFFAHRLACDLSPRIAAIVSLAGAQWEDESKCKPEVPVAVAEVHGTADETISYTGGTTANDAGTGGPYPSAAETVARWAKIDSCTAPLSLQRTLDLEATIPGAETKVQAYGGCARPVELWTIEGGHHVPEFQPGVWAEEVFAFFLANPKP